MYALLAVGLMGFQTPAAVPAGRSRDSVLAGAYLDPGVHDLVRRARKRAGSRAAAIHGYRALVTERMLFGVRALRRDRVAYRKEMAARIAWHRGGPDTVAVVGAREASGFVSGGPSVPSDLKADSPELVFDPASPRVGIGIGDSSFVYHPLTAAAEANYRYRSGDTTEIALAQGHTIRLIELQVIPRRAEFHLMAGSLWIDAASGDVVETLFRPARPFDFDRDARAKDRAGSHVPGFLKPIRAEVRSVTIEYALADGRWWLPRLLAFDGIATIGTLAVLPLRYERVYSDYEVEGDTMPPPSTAAPSPSVAPVAPPVSEARDSARARDSIVVRMPLGTAELLTNEAVPSPFELRDMTRGLAPLAIALPPASGVRLDSQRWLARYNRVEGLSLGAGAEVGLGPLDAELSARVGLADGVPSAELGVARAGQAVRLRVAAYQRLAVANPSTNALGIGNSLTALLLGRDDGAYYRAWGAELAAAPAITSAPRYALRVFWEREGPASTATEASLAHWLGPSHRFPGDIAAARAGEVGTAVTVRAPNSELTADLSHGSFDFARASLTTHFTASLPARMLAGVEGAVGASAGSLPVQSLWYLGGPATLRGYGGLAAAGETFWRGRLELAHELPAMRFVAFSDAGWAGPRAAQFGGRALVSVGGGMSALDGLLRLDLARALRAPVGWRLDVYVNGVL